MGRTYAEQCAIVLNECSHALAGIDNHQVQSYLTLLQDAQRIFFVGVGRVLLSLEAIAKRYAHLGMNTVIVGQITEPAITAKDLLIVGSGSGGTLFPAGIARKAKSFGAKIVHIGYNPDSPLKEITDLFLRIPVGGKTASRNAVPTQQPMTSLFEQSLLLFGDVTAMMILDERQIDLPSLWQCHANLE